MIRTPNAQNPDVSSFFKETGTAAYLLITISIFSFLFFSNKFIFVPPLVIHYYQVWRMMTYSLASPKLIILVFQILFIILWGRSIEKSIGTIAFIFKIVTNSIILSIPCLIIQSLGETIFKIDLSKQFLLFSIWPLYFWQLSFNCFSNPDKPTQTFFVPVTFPNRYLPFVILIINFMFNQRIAIVDFMPIVFGLLEAKYPICFARLEPNDRLILWLEDKLSFLGQIGTFYKRGIFVSTNAINSVQSNSNNSANSSVNTTTETPKITTGKVKVGGKVLTKEERRAAWIKKFGAEGQEPPDDFTEDYEEDPDMSEDLELITKKELNK